jgi:hypothetical protein
VAKYLAYDLEIAKPIPEGESDWKKHRPLGITCAAAIASDGHQWLWYGHDGKGLFTPQMTGEQCRHMMNVLGELADNGYTLLSWNGLGFDFDILAEESQAFEACSRMALDHVDMMFHFFCERGYPLGLDAAAKGMELPGKPEGMTGAKAPELWENGEYTRVLEYVVSDVKNTLAVAEAVEKAGRLNWTARSGRPNSWPCDEWLTVAKALKIPEPDTAWMTDPWSREKFYEWTNIQESPQATYDPDGGNDEL